MGAAGYVTVYDEAKVREAYEELWGDLGHSIEDDWTYPSWDPDPDNPPKYDRGWVVRIPLGGRYYLFDYADDQGNHEGVNTSFWFNSYAVPEAEATRQWDEIDSRVPPEDQPWEIVERRRGGLMGASPAQARVLCALRKVGSEGQVEVWT